MNATGFSATVFVIKVEFQLSGASFAAFKGRVKHNSPGKKQILSRLDLSSSFAPEPRCPDVGKLGESHDFGMRLGR